MRRLGRGPDPARRRGPRRHRRQSLPRDRAARIRSGAATVLLELQDVREQVPGREDSGAHLRAPTTATPATAPPATPATSSHPPRPLRTLIPRPTRPYPLRSTSWPDHCRSFTGSPFAAKSRGWLSERTATDDDGRATRLGRDARHTIGPRRSSRAHGLPLVSNPPPSRPPRPSSGRGDAEWQRLLASRRRRAVFTAGDAPSSGRSAACA